MGDKRILVVDDVHIRMLRKKFDHYNVRSLSIKTVQGVGYKLIESS
ncbi:winged helix-turn-helix domain-containing protein [Sporohalobacter salinus]|nr:winged helix-turn-helix domain-containing protein [Sporohalobacter salinus]MBM7624958.1 DNA-binding response OmpR family regulator [Sporohalobacter salinus]